MFSHNHMVTYKFVRSYISMLSITIKKTFLEENEMILNFKI